MRRLRDDPQCADEEFAAHIATTGSRALQCVAEFDPEEDIAAPYVARACGRRSRSCESRASTARSRRPRCFERAGFEAHDVHMSDLLAGPRSLAISKRSWPAAGSRTAMCWEPAKAGPSPFCSTRRVRDQFARFFARPDTFTPGYLQRLPDVRRAQGAHPGHRHWPRFVRNRSEQYEARFTMVEILRSPSVVAGRHGRFVLADRGGAWRRPGGVSVAGSREACAQSGLSPSATSITIAPWRTPIPSIRTARLWESRR